MKRAYLLAALLGICDVTHAATMRVSWTFDTSNTATCEDNISKAALLCPLAGFEIYLQQPDKSYQLVDTVGPSVRSKDYVVNTGETRCYRVIAISSFRPYTQALARSVPLDNCFTDVPAAPQKNPQGVTSITITVKVTTP